MKRILWCLYLPLIIGCSKGEPQVNQSQDTAEPKVYRYLALGDSYTIGTAIGVDSSYSAQLRDSLISVKPQDSIFYQVIATNGWTTRNLLDGIATARPDSNFDAVSLLIGVNNQYQRRSIDEYEQEFTQLLNQAIAFAKNQKERVIVISIPDWGVSSAGAGNRNQIATEIDAFNAAQKAICDSLEVDFIDITPLSRTGLNDPKLIAQDGLHFSATMQRLWMLLMYDDWFSKISMNP